MFKSCATILAAVTLIALPAKATAPEQIRYRVALKMFDGPTLPKASDRITTIGKPAQFVAGDKHEYFQLVATPTAHDRVHIDSSLIQWTPTGLMKDGEILDAIVDAKPSIIILGRYDATSKSLQPMRVEVSITRVAGAAKP